ncbi:dipeptidase 1 isoform 2-T2 [Hipposideros larvatus]
MLALPLFKSCVFCSSWIIPAQIFIFLNTICLEVLPAAMTEALAAPLGIQRLRAGPRPPHASPAQCHLMLRPWKDCASVGAGGPRLSGIRQSPQSPQSLACGAWQDKDPGSMGTLALQDSDPSPKVQPAQSEACWDVGPAQLTRQCTGQPGREQRQKQAPGDCVMWISWWLWPLVGICMADRFREEAERIMRDTPVIDGHNDLPWQLLEKFNNQLRDQRANLTSLADTHTNIPKLKAGFVGGQFWSAYTPCETQNKDAVRRTLEQIDVIHRMCQMYPETFMCVTSSQGIRQAFQEGKVASLVGVEGGHSIDSSLGVLRALYHLGMRYLTLTHSCNTPWADNWLVDSGDDEARSQGLSSFGQSVVREMNRLGILIDLAHVSVATMKATLKLSKAPVIFSHSSAYTLCAHRRNVPDDVLQLVNETGSLVMVNFYNDYVSCKTEATLSQVADHLDHIKKVAGAGAVGFGGDFDGVSRLPSGLEDVSKYPDLVAELLRRQWTEEEVKGALAVNLLRVFEAVEKVSDHTQSAEEEPIPLAELETSCRTTYGYSEAPSLHQQPGALLTALAPLLLSLSLL